MVKDMTRMLPEQLGKASSIARPFRIRWLGRVNYRDALALQRGLFKNCFDDHLLLLEHHPVYTLGSNAGNGNLLVPLEKIDIEVEKTDRGGDVTFHGPGQLVGYPLLHLSGRRGGGLVDTVDHIRTVEGLLVQVCTELGLKDVGRLERYPGVWVEPEGPNPRKIAAIGVRMSRGRTMHGFALNVHPDLTFFEQIVPCGITEYGVTSMAAEGISVDISEVVDVVARLAAECWAKGPISRADVASSNEVSNVSAFTRGEGPGDRPDGSRKPEWMKVRLDTGPTFRQIKKLMRNNDLVTVCEEAGCPNIFECWNDGTATFMINGDRCTRACGFCLVDTRRPSDLDSDEPGRVAEAVLTMGLNHTVVTAVARDDLADGGASAFAATVSAIRMRAPTVTIELLIPDCKGDPESLNVVFGSRPDVLNHNLETVARLQRTVRPSASYARSLSVLARAKDAGLITKSSLMVGIGESDREIDEALADLAGVGCEIVTIGQYLQPTTNHLPVSRWVEPENFVRWQRVGEALGITHIEAGPLVRSSYHAREAAVVSMSTANVSFTAGA